MSSLFPRAQSATGVGLVAVIFALAAYTIHSFFPALAWAAVLSIGLWPIHQRLQVKLSLSKSSSAVLLTAAVSLVFILPITWLSIKAAVDARPFLQWLNDANQNGLAVPDWVNHLPVGRDQIAIWWTSHLSNSGALSQTVATLKQHQPLQHGQALALHAAHHISLLIFTILTLFFLLQNGNSLARRAQEISLSLIGPTGEAIFRQVIQSVHGTISGLVLVGIGEGIVIGLAYFALGVAHAALLTIVTAVAAMLPFCAVVVVGIAGLLALAHSQLDALLVVVFGLAVIFIADHFVRPKLIGGTTNLPFLMVLFGILGGIETWGLIGLFVGPALMAVVAMFWQGRRS